MCTPLLSRTPCTFLDASMMSTAATSEISDGKHESATPTAPAEALQLASVDAPRPQGRFTLIYGPMKTCKTKTLIETANDARAAGVKVCLVKHENDVPRGGKTLTAHDGTTSIEPCTFCVSSLAPVAKWLRENADCQQVLIDEGGMFDADDMEALLDEFVRDGTRHITVATLDRTYEGVPFANGTWQRMLQWSPSTTQLCRGPCERCDSSEGVASHRLRTDDRKEISIGGSSQYALVCRVCAHELESDETRARRTVRRDIDAVLATLRARLLAAEPKARQDMLVQLKAL